MNGQLIKNYGRLWARNGKNIARLLSLGNPVGVYILCDGSTPVYVGKGEIYDRIHAHNRSDSKNTYWDHFSWFSITQSKLVADVEALIIRMLPFYLRSLNRQRPMFANKHARTEDAGKGGKYVDPPRKFPRFAPKQKKHKKR